MLVPVNPVWPNASGPKNRPADERPDGMSHPSALLSSPAERRVNWATVAGEGISDGSVAASVIPLPSRVAVKIQFPNRAKSRTDENKPACPATPPSAYAFSSWTSPTKCQWRNTVSISVGAIRYRSATRGLNLVSRICNGLKNASWTWPFRDPPVICSTTNESTIRPISEYTVRDLGG